MGVYFGWLYIHFPLLIGIAGFGVSIENVVSKSDSLIPANDRWLMCGSIALCLVSLAVIRMTSFMSKPHQSAGENSTDRNQALYALGAAASIILFAAIAPDVLTLYAILAIAIALGSLVVLDIKHHPFHRIPLRKA